MCIHMCIHMASKNISITEEVYNRLIKIKGENESFSEFFIKLLNFQKTNIEKSFGAWKLTEEEKEEIWGDITKRSERNWNKSEISDIK